MSDDMASSRPRMSKAVNRLTAKKIEKLKDPGRYHDGHGLLLQITESGSRSWLLRYQRNGRERMHGLGPYPDVGLKQARERARDARLKLLDGEDPIDTKRSKRQQATLDAAKATTFRQAAERFLTAHEGAWTSDVHRQQWHRTLETYTYDVIGDLPVAAIDTTLVLKVLEPIWTRETAKRLRGRIERILDWAKVRGLREGENPARWKGHLDKLLQKPNGTAKHHTALPFEDVPAFLTELRATEGIAARALEIAILTALRTGEVLNATWSEINLTKREWVIPAARMKAGKEHKVPLSPRVVEILDNLPREADNEFVFIGERAGRPIGDRAMFITLREMRPGNTVHGFRSTFVDWAHERTAFDNTVIEMALAHAVGTAVERAYRRTDLFDKRRALMETWAAFCAGEDQTTVVTGPWAGSAS